MELSDVSTMRDLLGIAFSIRYECPMRVYNPSSDEEYYFVEHFIPALERTFNVSNGIIVFKNYYSAFVIPYHKNIVSLLKSYEFNRTRMYVPFSSGEYPVERREQWEKLLSMV